MTVPSEGPRLVLQQKRCKLSVTRINLSSPNYRPAIFLTWSQNYQLSILPFHPPIPEGRKWCYLSLINYNDTHHVSIYFWPLRRGSLKRPLSTLLESTSKEDSASWGISSTLYHLRSSQWASEGLGRTGDWGPIRGTTKTTVGCSEDGLFLPLAS